MPPEPASDAIWVCPAVVSMNAADVAAALYAFSDLFDEVTEPSGAVVRDEVSFIVARYGKAAIECAGEWLKAKDGEFVGEFLRSISERLVRAPSGDRLDWCQEHVALAFSSGGT
jgi:hypothetical protein